MKLKILFLAIILTTASTAQDMNDIQQSSFAALNKISVTIGGDFITNGTFPAATTERVDEFITRYYNQFRLAYLTSSTDARSLAQMKAEIDEYAERGIILKHVDGTKQIIDLQKFRLTADYVENPYLLNGDVLIFPQVDWQRNFVEVEGAVNKPTQFQFVDGDRLSCAILFARGINPSYENADSIEITRLSYDGMNEEIIKTNVNENPELKRGDRVRVVAAETQRRDFKVLVEGEVNKPGYIFITKNQTTIKQIIEKAGGFKNTADLSGGELIRSNAITNTTNTPFQDRKRAFNLRALNKETDLLMMVRMADIEAEDSLSLIYDNQLRNAKSIVTVDFTKVLEDTSENSKFIVKDGDIIYIPEITNLVNVFGQVMNPGFVDFVKGQDYNYYISKSGGFGGRAKDAVFLVKNKTRAWIDMTDDDNNYTIESGDYIWVPKDIPRDFDHYLTRVSKIAAVVSGVATLYLIFK
ncbi:MAG: SLBB domain-containing protein [Bacteroidetes bacterium]|nr:SLBB domain-containing protein [Bacteroidota bacterium]MBU1117295.1 SLBB domain-containing protein [Bacteroidota bacterium]MBU1797365.1 SLBB domain-containing protein [Bacteroidota bacterium]